MEGIVRPLALVLAAGTLMTVSPAPAQPEFSPELLALLDPTAAITNLCGGKNGASSMRAMLTTAAAVVQQNEVARAPLYDGLGKVHLPVTT